MPGPSESSWFEQDFESLLDRFELAWRQGDPPDIEQFLAAADRDQVGVPRGVILEELVKIDLECRWRERGRQPAVGPSDEGILPATPCLEAYLRRFADLSLSSELIAEEYRVRHRWGDRPSRGEYPRRFPEQAASIESLLSRVDEDLRRHSSTRHRALDTDVELADSMPAPDGGDASSSSGKPRTVRDDSSGDWSGDWSEEPPLDSAEGSPEEPREEPPEEPPEEPTPMPEKIGRYDIERMLGRGAFGTVYLARDPQLGRLVAVKVPHPRRMRGEKDVAAFLREARLAATLRHPALVSVYDAGRDGRTCYLVMEYIEGDSLGEIVLAGTVPAAPAAQLIAAVAEAVHEAHKLGLVHRDLKPDNVLLDAAGNPHVTDFGLAIREDEQRNTRWQVSGTPVYMSPEQVRGESHRLDGRADLWSLGAMLYELLTGRRPFLGDSVQDIFDEIKHRDPKPPRQIDDGIPADLERICLKCLAKKVTDRYTTCKDLATDLRRFLQTSSHEAAVALPGFEATDASPRPAINSNVPAAPNRFIGREKEVRQLCEMLTADDTPIVTLSGPGGIGKTRLSQEVARALVEELPGGCWCADLTQATTSAAVAHAVLTALDVPVSGDEDPALLVAGVLELRRPMLLILDNFEQVVQHAPATVGMWRQRAPRVRLLVTCRGPLGVAGERQHELQPLSIPAADQRTSARTCGTFDSVVLFEQRAREIDSGFVLSDENAADVAEICAQLDGIPLAVELAAARVRILKPAQMLKKIGRKFELLTSTRRDLSPRQQTLTGAIDWSYNLLSDWERSAFVQASVLPGGFFLDAAEAIIRLDKFPQAPPVMDAVQGLREKCLLRARDACGEVRFDMYQSIREYGTAKGEEELSAEFRNALYRRAAEHLIDDAEKWDTHIHTAHGLEALDRVAVETDNLLAAQNWALAAADGELAARAILALAETMSVRGPADQRVVRLWRSLDGASPARAVRLLVALSEALRDANDWDGATRTAIDAVARSEDLGECREHVSALGQMGEMLRLRGEMDAALDYFSRAEEMARRLGDRQLLAESLASRGFCVWQRGELDGALACYDEAAVLARAMGDESTLARVARYRGHVYRQRGDYDGALACFTQSEEIARRRGNSQATHRAISSRGIIFSDRGDYAAAMRCYQQAERIARDIGQKRAIAVNRGNRGLALADQGDYEAALVCYAAAEAINREMGTIAGIALNVGNRGVALAAMGHGQVALECLQEAERLQRAQGNRLQIAILRGDQGVVLSQLGRTEEALAALDESMAGFTAAGATASPDYFLYQSALADVQMQLGNADQATALARSARQLAERLALPPTHPRLRIRESFAVLDRLLGGGGSGLQDGAQPDPP